MSFFHTKDGQRDLTASLKKLSGTDEGRLVFRWLIDACGLLSNAAPADSRRVVALALIERLNEIDPVIYARLVAEDAMHMKNAQTAPADTENTDE